MGVQRTVGVGRRVRPVRLGGQAELDVPFVGDVQGLVRAAQRTIGNLPVVQRPPQAPGEDVQAIAADEVFRGEVGRIVRVGLQGVVRGAGGVEVAVQIPGATGADRRRRLGAIGADKRHATRAGRWDPIAVGLLERTLVVGFLPLQGRGQVEGLQREPVHVHGDRAVARRVQVEEAMSEVLPGRTLHGGEKRLAIDRGEPAPGSRGDVDVPGVRVRIVAARRERRRPRDLEPQRDRRVRVGGRGDEVGPDLQVDDETEPPQQRRMIAHHGQLVMKVVLLGELGAHLLPGGGERLRLLGRRPGVEAGEGVQGVGGRAARAERPDQRLHGGVVLGTQLPGLPGHVVQSLAQPGGRSLPRPRPPRTGRGSPPRAGRRSGRRGCTAGRPAPSADLRSGRRAGLSPAARRGPGRRGRPSGCAGGPAPPPRGS